MKKIRYYIASRFLAAGASLTIGLLSFGGILAMVSSIPLALAGFVLSTVYEGQIYLENIKRAFKKLFKANHLERQVARDYLLDQIQRGLDADAPVFFKDYKAALENQHSNKKKLSDMEKWFAVQLFAVPSNPTAYQLNLLNWLGKQAKNEWEETKWQETRRLQQDSIRFVPIFCLVAGIFMGLGTTYLLMDAFLTIPMLAALPAAVVPMLIVPMALIAGAAYGLLIYNATTDMITTHTIGQWFNDIKTGWDNGQYAMAAAFGFMLVLSVALSLCTAGTWWTVVKTTPPLFAWMGNMPSWIMLRINPLISSASTLIFNAQNISETLDMVKEGMSEDTMPVEAPTVALPVRAENAWQRNNPFQFLIWLTFEPLRKLLFLGHLTSVSAVADRVPGVSAFSSALLGFVNELFEDAHYFFGEKAHPHKKDLPSLIADRRDAGVSHDHADDLPTQLLRAVFHVLYVPAALWDWGFSDAHQRVGFWTALERQRNLGRDPVGSVVCCHAEEPSFNILRRGRTVRLSNPSAWEFEHAAYRIERHKEKHLKGLWVGAEAAEQEMEHLTALQTEILDYQNTSDFSHGVPKSIRSFIAPHLSRNAQVYQSHGFFAVDTRAFLNELPNRVVPMALG